MSKFNGLKIAAKLFAGFGMLLVLLAGISSLSVISNVKSKGAIEDLIHHASNELLDQQVQKNVIAASAQTWMALASGNEDRWGRAETNIKTADDRLAELIKSTEDPARLAKTKQLAGLIANFKVLEGQLRSFRARNEPLDSAEGKELSDEAFQLNADVMTLANALADAYQGATTATEDGARTTADFGIMISGAIGLSSLLFGVVLAFFMSRSIKLPIVRLTAAMSRLAKGDLEVSIPNATDTNEIGDMAKAVLVFRDAAVENARLEREAAEHRAETKRARERNEQAQREAIEQERTIVAQSLGVGLSRLADKDLTYRMSSEIPDAYRKLQADFNAAIVQLETAMQKVAEGTDAIHAGSQDISTAADDLSRRTEQQAASLEETAAALEEITSTVKKSAEGAAHAREVVAAANVDANRSSAIVRQAVEAVGGIAKSAGQISQIIGVIDEIAFQTNLLALNAGVEAARAGDAGRGFAVVASEVRALAQRSAEAAKEIKGLISASTTQVEQGVKLVGETGKSLERMLAQVGEINDIVTSIASGAKEQATGLGEVNTAITRMDQVTQQNASMVEESTAASHSLSQETEQLTSLIGQFRLGRANDDEALRRQLQKVAPHAFQQAKAAAGSPRSARPVARKTMVVNGAAVESEAEDWNEF